eukprot:6205459-Pleurochrysis_carterae.AAC.6
MCVRLCGCAAVRLCGCAGVRVCGCACGCVRSRSRTFARARLTFPRRVGRVCVLCAGGRARPHLARARARIALCARGCQGGDRGGHRGGRRCAAARRHRRRQEGAARRGPARRAGCARRRGGAGQDGGGRARQGGGDRGADKGAGDADAVGHSVCQHALARRRRARDAGGDWQRGGVQGLRRAAARARPRPSQGAAGGGGAPRGGGR